MKQVQVKARPPRRDLEELDPEPDYRDPVIARAKAAKRKQEGMS